MSHRKQDGVLYGGACRLKLARKGNLSAVMPTTVSTVPSSAEPTEVAVLVHLLFVTDYANFGMVPQRCCSYYFFHL